jgi:nucleoside-diphosphate-sugar epimerase
VKVLVTGASGFLGGHVVERLVERGYAVRALVRATSDTRQLDGLPVERAVAAVDAPETLPAAVRGVDAVVHCAGLVRAVDEAGFDRVNAAGTAALLAALRAHNPAIRRLVHVSSIAAGGPGRSGAERGPVSAYGRSKRRGEDAALGTADAWPVTVVRPPPVYGPRDREILFAFQVARRGLLPVLGPAAARFSMIHVADCAGAIVAALEWPHPSGAIFPVDDGAEHSWASLAAALAPAVGVRRVRVVPLPAALVRLAGRLGGLAARALRRPAMLTEEKVREILTPDWVCGHAAIAAAIGWRPQIAVADGFVQTAAWYRSQGWL